MAYTRVEVEGLCKEWLEVKTASGFYDSKYKNWVGTIKQSEEYSSDVVAEFVLSHIEDFRNIKELERTGSYNAGHSGVLERENSNRKEERVAVKLFNNCNKLDIDYEFIGKIIDYQTPLQDGHVPAIDLLSVKDTTLYILELKQENSTENLLRCVLEAYTYSKQVNVKKIIDDFGLNDQIKEVVAAPLIYCKNRQMDEFCEMRNEGKRPFTYKLMEELDIKTVFAYREDGGKYYFKKEEI
ncbi:hypothetical protein SAMN02745247_00631 [Butyrivibrio hungatei DSM 14810]|uniref:Uncharacterized protein n=1 Tax=Butyrivibrio hungatei DSM 14810 TaxID=1121132 RepID=A0A1M7RXW0_9FIRM|nr:hypothetical protein [Butyrivibrio hungatei]SHN51036.1 hypothetical protein SAMN02745247_00631 [Butyrivibrio hungatei DSM 14810]